jgi:hypothetical protein
MLPPPDFESGSASSVIQTGSGARLKVSEVDLISWTPEHLFDDSQREHRYLSPSRHNETNTNATQIIAPTASI